MTPSPHHSAATRAVGCLLGQLAGDALGAQVEFKTPAAIRAAHPTGLRTMADGGTWNTLAGQPTDDSELALSLARMLVARSTYDPEAARAEYRAWLNSEPFDCGRATAAGLSGKPLPDSQANGALMRIAPLGIFGAGRDPAHLAAWARADAALTHPHPVCRQANALFACALAHAVAEGPTPRALYAFLKDQAHTTPHAPALVQAIADAAEGAPRDYLTHQGWVLIALHNALYQLLHAPDLETGLVDTVMRGGDTDTNAAICGALLGAVYGRDAVPATWRRTLANCRPAVGTPGVYRPRPTCYWPVDAEPLALALYTTGHEAP